MSSQYFPPYENFSNNIEVELDFCNKKRYKRY